MAAELQIQETLPVLACNFEALKAWATELVERYADIVVTEDAIAAVKKDMAEINRAKKAVDEARKEAVRRVSEPIRSFEAQIREIFVIFEDAYLSLSTQVKAFEDAEREEKRKAVFVAIQNEIAQAYPDGITPDTPDIPIQDKWLNKSASMKSIRADVQAIIERRKEEEKRRKAQEQAQQDRAAAIESRVRSLNEKHGLNLPVSRFLVGMGSSASLADVLADTEKAYVAVLEREMLQRERQSSAVDTHVSPVAPRPEPGPVPAPVPGTRAMSIVIEYAPENQGKVTDCLKTLRTLCVSFTTRVR
jgi:hypothetical protein